MKKVIINSVGPLIAVNIIVLFTITFFGLFFSLITFSIDPILALFKVFLEHKEDIARLELIVLMLLIVTAIIQE